MLFPPLLVVDQPENLNNPSKMQLFSKFWFNWFKHFHLHRLHEAAWSYLRDHNMKNHTTRIVCDFYELMNSPAYNDQARFLRPPRAHALCWNWRCGCRVSSMYKWPLCLSSSSLCLNYECVLAHLSGIVQLKWNGPQVFVGDLFAMICFL